VAESTAGFPTLSLSAW